MEMTMNVMFKNFWVFAAVLVFMVNASTQANAVELSNKTVLENHALWNSYRKRFIMADGYINLQRKNWQFVLMHYLHGAMTQISNHPYQTLTMQATATS